MINRKKNTYKKFIFNQYVMAVLGLALIVIISIPLAKNMSKQYKVNLEIKELEKEIEKMEGKNSDLNNLIEYLSSDQFVMEQARLNLNYKKAGEEIVVVKDADEAEPAPEDVPSQNSVYKIKGLENQKPPEKESNPKKWMAYFFD